MGAARALNTHEVALIEVLDYAGRVREYGGTMLRSAAVVFELADQAGAASIHGAGNANARSSGPLKMPSLPPAPHQPPIATAPELPSLPSIGGDVFASELHSGPGASDLRDFSRAWHDNASDITRWADDTRAVGFDVNEHWSSGDQAANNVIRHAKWLDSAAAWAERLSVAAEAVAHAFDVARHDTPTPDEFADAQSDVMEASALAAVSPAIGIIQYNRAASRYADLYAKAEEAANQYHSAVGSALTALGDPIVPCPQIATEADIPKIPAVPFRSGEVPPDVEYVADQIPGAPAGPGIMLNRRPKRTVLIDGMTYIGGDQFFNNKSRLPAASPAGEPITYREYDRHPYVTGVRRDADRIVVGSDGSRYFTSDHYETFVKF
ncbi:ribonuclease domain-containing protein [Mycolicibacterium sp.]|uniref:PPE domain-containing protein n=1 Tax=Mycolicibacterium sp. TaxID=2320850 RepID=UPI001A3042B8|nr:ribonuclease domain-containing protein [Mycolicibacterium sp.]MBJ7336660.1 PPE domain-containing protein [Mycolicibacterium sp.]